jgi:hypothetical protein
MVYSKTERFGPLTGIAAVVLWIVGAVVMFGLPTGLADNATDIQTLAWIKHNSNIVLAGGWIFMVGCLCFLLFLGVLRSRLLVSEGGPGTLTTIAFSGGIGGTLFALLLPAPDVAAAINKNDISPATAGALHNMSDTFFVGSELTLIVLLVGVAVLGFATRVVPRWFAAAGLLLAVVLLIGPIGWAGLMLGMPVWTLCASVLLLRAANVRRRRSTAPTVGSPTPVGS